MRCGIEAGYGAGPGPSRGGDERCRELLAAAAAACHRCYRRLWTISRLPFRRMRRSQSAAPDLPAQRFRHERGAKIWIWRPQADRSKIPKDFWEPIWQTLSRIARGRLGMRRVAAFSRQVSLLGNRNAFAATLLTIRTVPELGSTRAQLEPLHHTACSSKGFSISRAPGGTRDVTRRRSEPSHRSAHRCKQ